MTVKIALVGAHSSGKTTVYNHLQKVLPIQAEYIPEVARECPYPINSNGTFKSQLWMIHTQILRELEASQRSEVVICDRSVFDPAVYWRVHTKKSLHPAELIGNIAKYDYLNDLATQWTQQYQYTHIFLFTPIQPIIVDGVRDADPQWQIDVGNEFIDYFQYNRPMCPVTVVHDKTREQRCKYVADKVMEILKREVTS